MSHQIHIGSNLDVLPTLPDNSVDAIVTDPPYELGFMGKAWDASGIAYNVTLWRECLRVLKPGGHLLAFSGSRTYHRMTCAIEDAGFEVRDQIMWVYGSGFPKSHNVSKAFDKSAGAERDVIGTKKAGIGTGKSFGKIVGEREKPLTNEVPITAPTTDAAKQWDGWGTALKPAHEPICVARKPLEGTVVENVRKWGVGGLNIDGCRVGTTVETWPSSRSYGSDGTEASWSTGSKGKKETQSTGKSPNGRWPANLIHDGSQEVLELFPQTGVSQGGRSGNGNAYEGGFGAEHYGDEKPGYGDKGSAARFFYCPKASKSDRNDGASNNHPTVKPTDLMAYLCRLVTPPGGTILDPFTGSGSTGRGAVSQGFNFIGIELAAEYAAIAEARIKAATK